MSYCDKNCPILCPYGAGTPHYKEATK
ncbi:hypothetical protein CITRIK5_30030 [Citricoccus sp. K5]|nr:hypothetical protein CITRIK5_30030 [Citricoccus sp. K5]